MKFSEFKALGLAIGVFVAVYAPAFAATALVRPRIEMAIPLIIGITFSVALGLIFLLARGPTGMAEFGFSIPKSRYIVIAGVMGLPLAMAVTWLSRLFPAKLPFDVSGLPLWMIGLYFVVGSPVQEELVFRGLIQSILEQRWRMTFSVFGGTLSCAVTFTAVLFCVIHLEAGLAIATGAIVLGLVAGELRRRSGSLLPAVIVHALFNVADAVWPRT